VTAPAERERLTQNSEGLWSGLSEQEAPAPEISDEMQRAFLDAKGAAEREGYGGTSYVRGLAAVYPLIAAAALASCEAEVRRKADQERDELLNALADCVVKATEYGEQDGGFVATYLLPTGPLHRAIPLLDRYGITVRPGFDGRES
jgi:hypothetical protein